MAERSPQMAQPSVQCGAAMCSKWGQHVLSAQAGVCTEQSWEIGLPREQSSPYPLSPVLGASRVPARLPSGFQAPYSPPVSLSSHPASQGGSSSLCQAPGLGHPIYGSNCSLPRAELWPWILLSSSESPPWGEGPSLISSLPFLPGSMFSPWLYRRLYDSFKFVCSENYSTARCILDVFMGRSELHVLLCHLDPSLFLFLPHPPANFWMYSS